MWNWLKEQALRVFNFLIACWQQFRGSEPNNFQMVVYREPASNGLSRLNQRGEREEKEEKEASEREVSDENPGVYEKIDGHGNDKEQYIGKKDIKVDFFLKRLPWVNLAKQSDVTAICLLKSRFLSQFNAEDLANIYYAHRHSRTFHKELIKERQRGEMQYPNDAYIPPLTYVIEKAKLERSFPKVWLIIATSVNLLHCLYRELHPQEARTKKSDDDPYQILEVERAASEDEIKKAYRKKAMKLHPDKIKTAHASRFIALQQAYAILSDAEKRADWDREHPVKGAEVLEAAAVRMG